MKINITYIESKHALGTVNGINYNLVVPDI